MNQSQKTQGLVAICMDERFPAAAVARECSMNGITPENTDLVLQLRAEYRAKVRALVERVTPADLDGKDRGQAISALCNVGHPYPDAEKRVDALLGRQYDRPTTFTR